MLSAHTTSERAFHSVDAHVGLEVRLLQETLATKDAFKRAFFGVDTHMSHHVAPLTKRLPAQLARERLNSGVYNSVLLKVPLVGETFAAHIALDSLLDVHRGLRRWYTWYGG